MKKKISIALSWLLVVCVLLAQPMTAFAVQSDADLFLYEDYGEDGVGITGYNGDVGSLTDLTVPAEIDGRNVTSIVEDAFKGLTALKNVIIPEGIRYIGNNSFSGCTSLESVKLADSVNYIGIGAFNFCTALASVELPKNLKEIGVDAFGDCTSLKSVSFSDSLYRIDGGAFLNCPELKDITIPSGVNVIEDNSLGYYYDAEVENVKPVEGFKITGYKNSAAYAYAMQNAFDFESVGETTPFAYRTEYDDTLAIFDYYGDKSELTELVIPSEIDGKTVESIEGEALRGFENIESVTIPDSVLSIDEAAFADCPNLWEVSIPKSVNYIGLNAFGYRSTTVSEDETAYVKMEGFKISGYTNSEAEVYARENGFEFESLGEVSHFAYHSANDGTICINDYKGDRSALVNLEIPSEIDGKKVSEICYSTFSDCPNLESVTIPDGIERIDYTAFVDCEKLKQVNIPSSVKFIDEYAFGYCYDQQELENDVFKRVDGFQITGYKNSAAYAYARDNAFDFTSLGEVSPLCCTTHSDGNVYICAYYGDKSELNVLDIPETIDGKAVYGIDAYAFALCGNLETVILPDGLREIGYGAFSDCQSLSSVVPPNTLELIEGEAFYNCPLLKQIDLPGSLVEIGAYSLGYYNEGGDDLKVEDFTISGYTHSYGYEYAIDNGFKFEIVDAVSQFAYFENEDGTITIYDFIEDNKENINGIAIPDMIDGKEVVAIDYAAFAELTNLKLIAVPDSVTTILDYAIGYHFDKNIWDYVKTEGFTILGYAGTAAEEYALENGIEFVNLNINESPYVYYENQDGTITLAAYFPDDAASLTEVVIPGEIDGKKVTGISGNLLENCPNVKAVTLPDYINYIENMALGYFYDYETMDFTKIDGFTIYGAAGTAAEQYAIDNGFDFVALDDGLNYIFNENEDGTINIIGYCGDDAEELQYAVVPNEINDKQVTSIDDCAFANCKNLKFVTVPNTVKSIGEYAIGYWFNLETWELEKTDGVIICGYSGTASANYAKENGFRFIGIEESIGYVYFEGDDGSVSIVAYCGKDMDTVEEITIPRFIDGETLITSIGDYAFANCPNLKHITVPPDIDSIGQYAIGYYIDDNDNPIKIDGFTIYGNHGTAAEEYAIENDFKFVDLDDNFDFLYMDNEDGTVSILLYCGDDVSTVEFITVPNEIDGKKVVSICEFTFANCKSLKYVAVPDTVKSIGEYALGYYFDFDSSDFVKIDNFTVFGYSGSAAESYAKENNFNFIGIMMDEGYVYCEYADGSAVIIAYSGEDMATVGELVVPSGIDDVSFNAIGEYAFANCRNLKSVIVPANIESIGEYALGYYIAQDGTPVKIDGFTIYGYSGTAAEQYALDNGFEFADLDVQPSDPTDPSQPTTELSTSPTEQPTGSATTPTGGSGGSSSTSVPSGNGGTTAGSVNTGDGTLIFFIAAGALLLISGASAMIIKRKRFER